MRWHKHRAPWLILIAAAALARAAGAARDASPQLVYGRRYAMGTVYEIAVYSRSRPCAAEAIQAAFRKIVALDRMMSDYDPDSGLSRLDRGARFRAVLVPTDLFRVIQASLAYSRLSEGKYDITVGPLMEIWRRSMSDGTTPTPPEISHAQACTGYRKVRLVPPDRIELHSGCMRLDLGSIGKGYAVDRAVDVLRLFSVHNALISAGASTLYGMGAPPGKNGWLVRLRDPSGRVSPEITLNDESVSTSEQEKTSLIGLDSFAHIVDPQTGRPVRSDLAVSVAARTATAADGLSTALFLTGPQAGARLVRKLRDTAAIWISPAGEVESVSTGPRIVVNAR